MGRSVLHNNRGVTLIEMMIAMVILMIVSLALMKTSLLATKFNLQNALRDEAVSIVESRMNQLRSLPFTNAGLNATVNAADQSYQRAFRSFTENYNTIRTITDLNADTKQITVAVSWIFSRKTYTHTATTILRKQ